jgi:hypothetical protein
MSKTALALALAFLLTLSAQLAPSLCFATGGEEGGGHKASAGRASGIAIWHPDRILDAGAPLNGVVAGDFLTKRPGNEALAADASGRLWLAWRENFTWRSQVAWSAAGNLTSLAAGELDGASPGMEVACALAFANGTGAVFVVSGLGGQASARPVLSSSAKITAVAAGDVQGSPGAELVALDAGGNVSVAFPNSPVRSPQNIIRLPGPSCLVVADLDAASPGEEVAVGTSTGEVVELFWDGLAWQERGLWVSDSAVACLAFGDADPLHDGPELAMASASGELTFLERLGDTWSGRAAGNPGWPVSALAIGEADADLSGNELVAGLPDNATMIRWDGSTWARERLWSGSGACNRLLVAEVDADHAGNEVLAAGAGGALTALGLYHPGFSMSAGDARLALTGGETASFRLVFTPFDKLGGNLTLTVGTLPAGIAVASGPGQVALSSPNVSALLNLSVNASLPNGEYRFLVTASSQAGLFDSAWLTLVLERKVDFQLALATRDPEVQPGGTATYTVTVSNAGTVNDSYRVEARVAGGWALRFPDGNLTGRVAPGQNHSLALKVTAPKDAAGRTAKLAVNATSLAQSNITRSASMKVVVPQKGAPCGLILLPAGLVGTAFMLGRKGNKREEK